MVGRICWFSSKSGLIYTTLEMLMHACMRDEVVWFALMPVREEQQPASSGVRCCFSSLVNTLSVLALHSLPSSPPVSLPPTPLGESMKVCFISSFCHSMSPVYCFVSLC